MNRNFVLILALLSMLSMVNSIPFHKRKSTFHECPIDVPALDVSVSPDPIVAGKTATYTISGTLKSDLTDKYQLYIVYTSSSTPKQTYDICSTKVKCPVPAGTKFDLTQDSTVPSDVTQNYCILVGIVSKDGSLDVLSCSEYCN